VGRFSKAPAREVKGFVPDALRPSLGPAASGTRRLSCAPDTRERALACVDAARDLPLTELLLEVQSQNLFDCLVDVRLPDNFDGPSSGPIRGHLR
jgi:hypothetical protein